MLRCKYIVLLTILALSAIRANGAAPAAACKLSGRVLDSKTGAAVCGAVIGLEGTYLWAVADREGKFAIAGIQPGEYTLQASSLGYVSRRIPLSIDQTVGEQTIRLAENSLAIEEVVVTAREKRENSNTTLIIGRNALDHLQLSGVTDVAALLPGGKTANPDLTSEKSFSLRDGGTSAGNAAFGTAVEVDGVRMGNNASFGAPGGVGTRSVAVANIESVEVITGVPSAEYGDINSGIVRIHTRKGRTPWNVLFAVNPRTYQVSASKGIDLENDAGVLNVSAEWTRATRKLTSPYTSYSRRGLSAAYSNTFGRVLRFEAGISGNIGGMNSEDDPDAFTGAYTKGRDNLLQGNTSLTWLLNKPWITNLRFAASVNFHDSRSHAHDYNSYSSEQPAVHATQEGYFLAGRLPLDYFSDRIVDSKELAYAASVKYEWNRRWGGVRSNLKAGVQWKATGNAGRGEYYENPAYAPTGYRPRPYSDYPFMHNLSLYAEEQLRIAVGSTTLQLTAGVRLENLSVRGTRYDRMTTFSPRLNARWRLSEGFTVRGGWGITEKLPSYHVLYPRQEYRDIQTFGVSYDNRTSYIYYTQPYTLLHNPALGWQRSRNAELGFEAGIGGAQISLVGYWNRTKGPYKYSNAYTPLSYNLLKLPDGYAMPATPQLRVDPQTGIAYVRGSDAEYWTAMEVHVTDRTFVQSTTPDNGADITRAGAELIVDFPEITPLRTRLRLDAAYGYTSYVDDALSYYYQTGWSHTSLPDRSYQYVGIYANGGNSSSSVNGRRTHSLDANLTAITHIPRARIVITCRLEMSLVKRSQNLSRHNGAEYAYNVSEAGNAPTGGSIYDGRSYTAIRPVAYLDLDGRMHPFTDAEAADDEFVHLILKSGNAYTFAADGYDPYFSANLSITKEIGDHVSLSFFANNFTNAQPHVTSYATGVSAIFTPDFYYGLTCRIKF